MSVLIEIDTTSSTPFFRQIVDRIIQLIETEAVKPGTRLPATRQMADQLSVNRSTVYKAYQELWAMGYLESKPGSYTTVRRRIQIATRKPKGRSGLIPWAERTNAGSEKVFSSYLKEAIVLKKATGSNLINFIPLSPDNRLLPVDTFRKCMNDVLARPHNAELLQYGSPLGYAPLREYIAERMRVHSVWTSPDEIMITLGAQNAIELLLKSLTVRGESVVIEGPTYSRVIDLLLLNDLKVIEVPMKSDGLDLDRLENILGRSSAALIYTMPTFHNPTGVTTAQGHRERLLSLCENNKIPLIEDGFEEELKYFGKAVLPIKSMDSGGVVIYIGTFSKILFPGLRIGWIAADKALIDSLAPIQRASTLGGNLLNQAAVCRFCRMGLYELHLKRAHQAYRNRMKKALEALHRCLSNEQVDWIPPAGGYTLWLTLKDLGKDESQVVQKLLDHGIAVSPGSSHFYRKPSGLHLRLSIAHLDEQEIEEGIKRLAAGLKELYCQRG